MFTSIRTKPLPPLLKGLFCGFAITLREGLAGLTKERTVGFDVRQIYYCSRGTPSLSDLVKILAQILKLTRLKEGMWLAIKFQLVNNTLNTLSLRKK